MAPGLRKRKVSKKKVQQSDNEDIEESPPAKKPMLVHVGKGTTPIPTQAATGTLDESEPSSEANSNKMAAPTAEIPPAGQCTESAPTPAHVYGTRASNRDRHPGIEAGLARRTRAAISEDANLKKSLIEAERAKKSVELAAMLAELNAKKDEIAHLEDLRATELAEEALKFNLAPSPGSPTIQQTGADIRDTINKGLAFGDAPVASEEYAEEQVTDGNDEDYLAVEEDEESSDEESSHDAPNAPQKLSRTQQKAIKRRAVREDLAARRAIPAITPVSRRMGKQDNAPLLVGERTSGHKNPPAKSSAAHEDAFSTSWRRKLQERGLHSQSRNLQSSRATAPLANNRKATGQKHSMEGVNADNILGGFTDDDVFVDRGAAFVSKKQTSRPNEMRMPLAFEEVTTEGGDDTPLKPRKKGNLTSARKGKKHSGSLDEQEDRSAGYDALPAWTKPHMKTVVAPTLREHIGRQDDPWSLDMPDRSFIELLQAIIDQVYPEHHYDIRKGDRIYAWCQQQVYDWRHSFQKVANSTVRDEMASRQANVKLSDYERSNQGVIAWLKTALQRGGAAIYGQPDTHKPHNAREQLGSKYMLKVLAAHLGGIVGSIAPEEAYPAGAIALAAAAVQRAFEWHAIDQPKGVKQTKFSLNDAGELTGFWRDTAVADLLEKPHRLDRILEQALQWVDTPAVKAKPSRSKVTAESLYMRERSSSPP